ncbi:hypothetical protein GLOTRDRAFT_49218 [Gloeophyllum trabeum ATCC 11539]|uniref:Uncharacterized protein n=1 Tax=Gloeophyllum trabeum (strain ATCC 11539 / FP-39264 / Madison 617) TaxID=670483 RepID=S7RAR5_GLOTA|nr:uncharacterized protein GLOTRDRAFT_49218 [Gloeophyllum trabeum ATCC 11539]EPQ51360.1 hypothetical protein GLOTRDRAFT_49218 [Gloeophyllum trabeum ATCC 11539]
MNSAAFDQSLPTPIHPLQALSEATPGDAACDNIYYCRTLSNIIWSCVATIFACTWVAIHPNIPALDKPWYEKLGRRIATTAVAIIAPELVVTWAAKQWLTSRRLAKQYHESHGWTWTHGFFSVMASGSELASESESVSEFRAHTCRSPELGVAALPFPDITEREIQDKSKGDWISKGLAILQTTWFILQCITRKAQGLPVTQLELATCAFAVLNAFTYGLWWNKPQSVDCPVSSQCLAMDTPATFQLPSPTESGVSSPPRSSSKPDLGKVDHCLFALYSHIVALNDYAWYFWEDNFEDYEVTQNILFFTLLPLSPFVDMMMGGEVGVGEKEVGAYYCGDLQDDGDKFILTAVTTTCATVFGAIHCIAWAYAFQSNVEQILWRGCSLAITCLPVPEGALLLAGMTDHIPDSLKGFATALLALLIPFYIFARITLLVLAFLSLTSLPAGAYHTVAWTNFIPHI